MIHTKKVRPEYFAALRSGSKTFEVRREEDGEPSYAVGDYLALNEYDPGRHAVADDQYTGRCLLYRISYVLRDFPGLAEGYVVLGIKKMPLCMDDLQGMATLAKI